MFAVNTAVILISLSLNIFTDKTAVRGSLPNRCFMLGEKGRKPLVYKGVTPL